MNEMRTLEHELLDIIEQNKALERNIKSLALRLHDLQIRYIASARTGFYDWIQQNGLARATAHRYIYAALAIRSGLDPDGTRGLTELADLGQALQHGIPLEELRNIQSADDAATAAKSARNSGIVRVRLTADYIQEWHKLISRAVDVLAKSGIEMLEPDAAGVVIARVNATTALLDDEQFRQWLEGATVAFHFETTKIKWS